MASHLIYRFLNKEISAYCGWKSFMCVFPKKGRMSIAIIPHHPNNQNVSLEFPQFFKNQPTPIHGRLAEFLGWNKAGLHVLWLGRIGKYFPKNEGISLP